MRLFFTPFALPGIVLEPPPEVIMNAGSEGVATVTCNATVPVSLMVNCLVWEGVLFRFTL